MLSPQLHKLQKNMNEPHPCTPEIPLVDAAVSVDEAFRNDPLGREVGHVLQRLIEHIRDDLDKCQVAYYGVRGRRLDCIRSPHP